MKSLVHIVLEDPLRQTALRTERQGDVLFEYQDRFEGLQIESSPQGTTVLLGPQEAGSVPRGGTPEDRWFRARNGRFLFISFTEDGELLIANDRFAAIPIYYAQTPHGLKVSTSFTALCQNLRASGDFKADPSSFYQFLHLQRLVGEQTFETHTRYLQAASVLRYRGRSGRLDLRTYWQPPSEERGRPAAEWEEQLADVLKGAYRSQIRPHDRLGLLLSGGMDSRMALAICDRAPTCYTVGDTMNNEYRVAHAVATQRGARHIFIPRPTLQYTRIFEDAVRLGGGMNAFDHAHFLGLGDLIGPRVDVLLHGYGLDFLFQGKYLPSYKIGVRGRTTFLQRLRPLGEDLAEQYFHQISYRLKSIDTRSLLQPRHREDMRESVYASVRGVLARSSAFTDNPYRQWEYLHTHNLSRHFTFLLLQSIRTVANERTLAFDNAVFDLYFRMPAESRYGGNFFRQALKRMDSALLKIVNANTNFPADYSPWRQTGALLWRKLMHRLGLPGAGPLPPSASDRSWTDRSEFLRDSDVFQARIAGLMNSDFLRSLDLFDMDHLRSLLRSHQEGKRNHADLVITLLTIEQLLKSVTETTHYVSSGIN